MKDQESEEEDYLSPHFLSNNAPSTKTDLTYTQKRQRIKYNHLHPKPKESPLEKTMVSLETPLSNDNKGFKMLEKMGYK